MGVRFAIIGFGAIGRDVEQLVRDGAAGATRLVAVLVVEPGRYAGDAARLGIPFVADVAEIVALRPDVVVEAAGHEAFRSHLPALLAAGFDVLALSVGALADPATMDAVMEAAERGNARLRVPSGAIAGLDAIGAAAVGRIDRVTHTVRKPPVGLLPDDEAATVIRSGLPRELFSGPAREAAMLFPANVNVVAAVSLAGIGLDRTQSRVIADPAVTRNTHDVEIDGEFGRLSLRMENIPGPNPKTGRIVAFSVVRMLRAYGERIVVGG